MSRCAFYQSSKPTGSLASISNSNPPICARPWRIPGLTWNARHAAADRVASTEPAAKRARGLAERVLGKAGLSKAD